MRRAAILTRISRGYAPLTSMVVLLSWLLAACGGGSATPGLPTSVPSPTIAAALASPAATRSPTATPATPTSAPASATTPPLAPGTPETATPSASAMPTATAAISTATTAPPTSTTAPTPVPRAGLPVRVKIPRIKVDAAIEYVGLAPDGAMDTPKDYAHTAWYEPGPRPGDQGNAAIAGHVDSKTGPAVFWDLPKLRPGDEVFVGGDDGIERRFVVVALESYGRADAPLDRIFGPTVARQLNLITCDPNSTFDRRKGEYAANVVVYTELAP